MLIRAQKKWLKEKKKDSFDDQFTHNVIDLKQNTAERKERTNHNKEMKQNEKVVKHHKEKQCFKVKSRKKCGKKTGKNGQNCVWIKKTKKAIKNRQKCAKKQEKKRKKTEK